MNTYIIFEFGVRLWPHKVGGLHRGWRLVVSHTVPKGANQKDMEVYSFSMRRILVSKITSCNKRLSLCLAAADGMSRENCWALFFPHLTSPIHYEKGIRHWTCSTLNSLSTWIYLTCCNY